MIGIFLKLASNKLIYQLLFFAFVCNIHGQDLSKPHLLLTNKNLHYAVHFPSGVKATITDNNNQVTQGRVMITEGKLLKFNELHIDPKTIKSLTLPYKRKTGLYIAAGLTLIGGIFLIDAANTEIGEGLGLDKAYKNIIGATFLASGLIVATINLSTRKKKYDLSKAWELKVHY